MGALAGLKPHYHSVISTVQADSSLGSSRVRVLVSLVEFSFFLIN